MVDELTSIEIRLGTFNEKFDSVAGKVDNFIQKQDKINDKMYDLINQNSKILVKLEEKVGNHLLCHDDRLDEHLENHKMNDLKSTFGGALGGGSIVSILGGVYLLLKDRIGL